VDVLSDCMGSYWGSAVAKKVVEMVKVTNAVVNLACVAKEHSGIGDRTVCTLSVTAVMNLMV
jgi:hypothetical protein